MFNCQETKKEDSNDIRELGVLGSLSEIFNISDSCNLHYTNETFPKHIFDIDFNNNNNIYVLGGNKKYPCVKFDRKGNFVGKIGKIGSGAPGEYPTNPYRMACRGDSVALLNNYLSTISLFIDSNFVKKMDFSPKIGRTSDICFINNNLLVSFYGNSDKLLYVLNKDFEIVSKKYDQSSDGKFASFIESTFWGLQKIDSKIILNILYPDNINISKFEDNRINHLITIENIKLSNYSYTNTSDTFEEKIAKTTSPFKFYKSFGKIIWISEYKGILIGLYWNDTDIAGNPRSRSIKQVLFFLNNDGELLLEKELENEAEEIFIRKLIPVNGSFLKPSFFKINNLIYVKIYFLSLRDEFITKILNN